MKKVLSIFLAVCLILGCLMPGVVSAASMEEEYDWEQIPTEQPDPQIPEEDPSLWEDTDFSFSSDDREEENREENTYDFWEDDWSGQRSSTLKVISSVRFPGPGMPKAGSRKIPYRFDSGEGFYVNGYWYGGKPLDVFRAGETYRIEMFVHASSGYRFAENVTLFAGDSAVSFSYTETRLQFSMNFTIPDGETDSPETDPTDPPETDPTDTPETDPTDPPETDPTDPPETDPTDPPETDPTDSPETDPTDPPETDPTDPPETDPTDPPETNPTDPSETDPTDPPETDPTDPPETDSTEAVPTTPPETEPAEPEETETDPTDPPETRPEKPVKPVLPRPEQPPKPVPPRPVQPKPQPPRQEPSGEKPALQPETTPTEPEKEVPQETEADPEKAPQVPEEPADAAPLDPAAFEGNGEKPVTIPAAGLRTETGEPGLQLCLDLGELEQLCHMAEEKDCKEGLNFTYGSLSVQYDLDALHSIIKQAAGAQSISLELENQSLAGTALNRHQQETLKNQKRGKLYSVELKAAKGEKQWEIHDFGGGNSRITVPYEFTQGYRAKVYRVEEDGSLTEVPCHYDREAGQLTFETPSHSHYVLAPAGEDFLLVWMLIAVLMGMLAAVLVLSRKEWPDPSM